MKQFILSDREGLTEEEKQLFLCDLKATCAEYFEADKFTVDVTKTEGGFSVCIIFDAARIKKFKRLYQA